MFIITNFQAVGVIFCIKYKGGKKMKKNEQDQLLYFGFTVSDVMAFISDGAFSEALSIRKNDEQTIKWVDIPVHVVYKVVRIEKRFSRYGECYIFTAENKERDTYVFFAPRSMVIQWKKNYKPSHTGYFISSGVEHFQLTHHTKFKYELLFVFDPSGNEITIEDDYRYPPPHPQQIEAQEQGSSHSN